MKKQHTAVSSKDSETTSANLEERFDAGDDVLDYFDLTKATITHGGIRRGAGRKATGKIRKTVKLSPAAIVRLEKLAKRRRLSDFSAAVEEASRLASRAG